MAAKWEGRVAAIVGDEIVGRNRELAVLADFIEAFPSRPLALLIEGEAGIGKTALWRQAVASVSAPSHRILVSRPGESEAKLSLAGIGDLLGGVADEILPLIPSPQRRALEVALLRADLADARIDARTISVAFSSSLTVLTRIAPVLIAIDDVQWLDPASARVMEFAVRRLRDEPVGILLCARVREQREFPLGIDRALPPENVQRLKLGPMNLAELHHLIRDAVGQAFLRPTLARIEAASRGNPLFALELARALLATGSRLSPGEPLPVRDELGGLLLRRMARLPATTRRLLLFAAASSAPTAGMLISAVRGDDQAGLRALARAERDDIIHTDGAVVRFTHPLIASAIYRSAPGADRRAVHRALSDVAPEIEERARHRALSTDGPDQDTASMLEHAALGAAGRGAPEGAAELMALSLRLTPSGRTRDLEVRSLALGRYVFQAGDTARGREVLEALIRDSADHAVRAEARLVLARIAWVTETSAIAITHVEAAVADAGQDTRLLAQAHVALADLSLHDKWLGLRHARIAVSLLEDQEDPDRGLLALALYTVALNEADLGGPLRIDLLSRAIELEDTDPPARVADRISHNMGVLLMQRDDFQGARKLLEESHRVALDDGDEGSLARILDQLTQLEVWSGNWTLAAAYAEHQFDQAERTGQRLEATFARIHRAFLDALLGRIEEASTAAQQTLAAGVRDVETVTIMESHRVLGFLELSRQNPAAADHHFSALDEIAERTGILDPGCLRHHADHIEALVANGEHERAEALLERLAGRARATDHRWGLATAARCRAMLLGARGDLDDGIAAADAALEEHRRLAMPFELGRTLLVQGMLHRRRRQKHLAKRAFERAAELFEDLGASLWHERTQAEMARLGERASGRLDLTTTERRVAELSATGLTNRDVSERLFMSPKTVEFNLAKVYRKMGIKSRAELGLRMAAKVPPDTAALRGRQPRRP
jgi:DNA-binding CsgD family transcriptional regulator